MSISFGFAELSYVTVPRSVDSASTSYSPFLSVNFRLSIDFFGSFLPLSSAEAASHVPSIAASSFLGSSQSATQGNASSTPTQSRKRRLIVVLRKGRWKKESGGISVPAVPAPGRNNPGQNPPSSRPRSDSFETPPWPDRQSALGRCEEARSRTDVSMLDRPSGYRPDSAALRIAPPG